MARESLFHTFADRLAQRMASHGPNREAEYLTWYSVICAVAADCFGGERIYGPRINQVELQQSRMRIAASLQAGEPPAQIARREGVTERHVRKVRGTIRP